MGNWWGGTIQSGYNLTCILWILPQSDGIISSPHWIKHFGNNSIHNLSPASSWPWSTCHRRRDPKSDVFARCWQSTSSRLFYMIFYQHFWEILQQDFFDIFQAFYDCNVDPNRFNRAYIALVPKTTGPRRIKEFQPISLINSIQKSYPRYWQTGSRRISVIWLTLPN